MSDNTHAVADHASETYREYSGKIQDTYIDGYDPVSFSAPHSSLLRVPTWVGMGLILSLLPVAGIAIWGVATDVFHYGTASQNNPTSFLIVGLVALVVLSIVAVWMVWYGRRQYRQYRSVTGRIN